MTQTATQMLQSFNPATGDLVGEVPVTQSTAIAAVVERARVAQKGWTSKSLAERGEILRQACQAFETRADEIGELMSREMGKPLGEAVGEVRNCGANIAAEVDEIVAALQPDRIEDDHVRSVVYHDPFGICAVITPWNFPLAMPHWLILPALVAGNSVVLKPSELTPLVAQAYADTLNAVLPADVLSVVHGADDQGKALVESNVDLIAFTGSRETGKKILGAASTGLKRVILELGGKDPLIVLDDADLEKAAKFAVHNSFRNAGQVCVSTERIYVDRKVAKAFEAHITRLTRDLKVGNGLDEGVKVGPMVNTTQRDHVLEQIDAALQAGARLVTGGDGHHDNFVMPTILADVSNDMAIMREETFGPVACVSTFDDVSQAVTLANETPFGLGAVVFGKDQERALQVARKLESGMVGVNKNCGGATGSPWVGAKESGYGFHSSKDGHRQFAQTRVVSLPRS